MPTWITVPDPIILHVRKPVVRRGIACIWHDLIRGGEMHCRREEDSDEYHLCIINSSIM